MSERKGCIKKVYGTLCDCPDCIAEQNEADEDEAEGQTVYIRNRRTGRVMGLDWGD